MRPGPCSDVDDDIRGRPVILVIGAAGKTGRAVTNAVLRLGIPVRAAVRPGSTNRPVGSPLVSRVEVDLETGDGLEAALRGVRGVYHLAPDVHPHEVDIARRVAEVAALAGTVRFAFHSVLHPEDASMPHHLRKGEAEAVVCSLHPTATVLRPAAYHQNSSAPHSTGGSSCVLARHALH